MFMNEMPHPNIKLILYPQPPVTVIISQLKMAAFDPLPQYTLEYSMTDIMQAFSL